MTKGGVPAIRHSTHPAHWIVEFIREERVRQQITQGALSLMVSPSRSTVSNYECGYCSLIGVYTVERILAALGYRLSIEKKSNEA